MKTLSGRIITLQSGFLGTVTFDETTGLFPSEKDVAETQIDDFFSLEEGVIFPRFGDNHCYHTRNQLTEKSPMDTTVPAGVGSLWKSLAYLNPCVPFATEENCSNPNDRA